VTNLIVGFDLQRIGVNAFAGCNGLEIITIPEAVNSIGTGAFSNCSRLNSINVDGIDSKYYSIDGILFDKTTRSLLAYPAAKTGEYTIPKDVSSVGNAAFSGCIGLTKIIIPESVTSIGYQAFFGCTNLATITIPNSVENIGYGFVGGCASIHSIIIGANNKNYRSIDGVAFDKQQSILVAYPPAKVGSYSIPESVNRIERSAFFKCVWLNSVAIPESVTSIGIAAFSGCSSLNNVTLPDKLLEIGEIAFLGCAGLNRITIPQNVSHILTGTFRGCTGLTNITISKGVSNFDWDPFSGCTNLLTVHFLGNAPNGNNELFIGSPQAIVYFNRGTRGWSATYGGRPTQIWDPLVNLNVTTFGIKDGVYFFRGDGIVGTSCVLEFATDLAQPVWKLLSTNSVLNGTTSFADPQWQDSPSRFYRIRAP
jgi:hypothetical protein